MVQLPAPLPSRFYRVQHADSHTRYDGAGFASRTHYHMGYGQWLNADKIHRHLDTLDRSPMGSPFISVYDNEADAMRRAESHIHRRYKDVIVAKISTLALRPAVLDVGPARLPAWQDEDGAVTFISAVDARAYLGVEVGLSDRAEWLALDYIPGKMIEHVWVVPGQAGE